MNPRPRRALAIGVIGPGRVGRALIGQLRQSKRRLLERNGLELNLLGVAGRERMWVDGADPAADWHDDAPSWRPTDIDHFARHVRGGHRSRHAMLIDCTASEPIAGRYVNWLEAGFHIVTPNKLACSGSLPRWQALRDASTDVQFRHEATVCAGLPVVQTLRDLIDTGDELFSIEGMFSGTLAWLCNQLAGERAFSILVREAHALGYTEPDPRMDLSGMDVARKLVILARVAGFPLSLEQVEVESLVPPGLAAIPLTEFMDRLDEMDAPMARRVAEAATAGGVLRHVAQWREDGSASVKLAVLPSGHAFCHTQAMVNVVRFTTRRYLENPLQVQGPGAGPEVTAAGVFGDILRIAETLRADV